MSKVTELRLLKAIEREGDCATKTIVWAEAGGRDGYERYFGDNGAFTRMRRQKPHPIIGINEIVEYQLVEIWKEGDKILHGRTEHGKRYQHLLWLSLYYIGPYSEIEKGKLQRQR